MIKVADFGLSRIVSGGRSSMTMSTASGSPGWMAPELPRFMEEQQEEHSGAKRMKMVWRQSYSSNLI